MNETEQQRQRAVRVMDRLHLHLHPWCVRAGVSSAPLYKLLREDPDAGPLPADYLAKLAAAAEIPVHELSGWGQVIPLRMGPGDSAAVMPAPICAIEFIGDGNALIERADGSERLVPAGEVADVLREEYPGPPPD